MWRGSQQVAVYKLRKEPNNKPLQNSPTSTLILDFWPPELLENKVQCLSHTVYGILYGNGSKWIHICIPSCVYIYLCTYMCLAKVSGYHWSQMCNPPSRKVLRKGAQMLQFSSVSVVSYSSQPSEPQQPGLPVHHQLPESTQTYLHWVSDAIQPSHPLSSPSPPAFNLSQYQGFFQWVSSSHQVAKLLEFRLQHQSFQWTPRTDLL